MVVLLAILLAPVFLLAYLIDYIIFVKWVDRVDIEVYGRVISVEVEYKRLKRTSLTLRRVRAYPYKWRVHSW